MPKIGTKLGTGIGILVALCVVIGLVSYTQTRLVAAKIEEVTRFTEPMNSAVYALENNLVETAFAALGYLSTGDPRLREAFQKNTGNFGLIEQRFHEAADRSHDWELWLALQQQFSRFHTLAAEEIAMRDEQAQTMESLLRNLDAIDALLTDKIVPSVKPDDPAAYRRLQAALEMEVNVNALTKALGDFLLTGQSRYEKRIQRAEGDFRKYFKVYQIVLLSSEEMQWTAELRRYSDESLGLARVIMDQEKRKSEKLAEFIAVHRGLSTTLSERLQPRTEKSLTEAKEDVLQAGRGANATILLVLLFSVVFGLAAGIVTTRNITGPLRQLVTVMDGIARGGRMQQITIRTRDELQSLGDSFNVMTGQLERANEQLRESELRFRTIFRDAPIGIALSDSDGRFIQSNPALEDMLGMPEKDLSGRSFDEILAPSASTVNGQLFRAMASGQRNRYQTEISYRREDGRPAWMNVNVSRMHPDRSPYTILMMEDVSARKETEEQLASAERRRLADLRRFAVSVQRAQEEERKRISRELHDDLSQRLSGMKFQVEALEDDLPPSARRAARALRDFRGELERSIMEVRRVSSDLRPSVLDDFGLVTALRILCSDFEKRHGPRTDFQVDDGGLTGRDPHLEIALYRITQEALANVARHAGASSVTLRLMHHESSLRLTVSDDGKGFDPNDVARLRGPEHGLGLISMRERSELLGGTFTVESAHNKGTTIAVTIPFQDQTSHEENENTDR